MERLDTHSAEFRVWVRGMDEVRREVLFDIMAESGCHRRPLPMGVSKSFMSWVEERKNNSRVEIVGVLEQRVKQLQSGR